MVVATTTGPTTLVKICTDMWTVVWTISYIIFINFMYYVCIITSPIYRTRSYNPWKAGVAWWCQCRQTPTLVSRVLQTLHPAHFPLFFYSNSSSHFSFGFCCRQCCHPWNEKQEFFFIFFKLYFNTKCVMLKRCPQSVRYKDSFFFQWILIMLKSYIFVYRRLDHRPYLGLRYICHLWWALCDDEESFSSSCLLWPKLICTVTLKTSKSSNVSWNQ